MSMVSGTVIQSRNSGGDVGLPSMTTKPFANNQMHVVPLTRVAGFRRAAAGNRRSGCVLEKTGSKFFGARLPLPLGSERSHLWQMDGPGRPPKLRVLQLRSALSQIPEKPLGLYDPSFDKDSCGVGFVAELSGESSRKTV